MIAKTISIRPATLADVPAIIPLVKASWARTYDPVIGEAARRLKSDTKHVPALFETEINDPLKASIVAFGNGVLIGHVGGEMRGEECFFVDHLHVEPSWFGMGVAGALMNGLRDYLLANTKPKQIELTVLTGNERAFAFYFKHGFVEATGENEDEGLGGRPSVLLRWKLTTLE